MVSTRQHPRDFPPPEDSLTKTRSPRKQSSRTSTASPAPNSPAESPESSVTLTKRAVSNTVNSVSNSVHSVTQPVSRSVDSASHSMSNAVTSRTSAVPSSLKAWSHTASNVTIAWLLISLPLQIWDTLYILLRPHTMAGGALQWPFWKPYEIYVQVDRVYGNVNDPWGGAQGAMNAIETVLYGLYIMIALNHGVPSAHGKGLQISEGVQGWIAGGRRVEGRNGNIALLIGFTAAVMTLAKTVMYYFVEYFAKFENVKHNDWMSLFIYYIVLNGLWIVFPAYMTFVFGSDIMDALNMATDASTLKKER